MSPGKVAYSIVNQPVPRLTDGLEQPGGKKQASKAEMKIRVWWDYEDDCSLESGLLIQGM